MHLEGVSLIGGFAKYKGYHKAKKFDFTNPIKRKLLISKLKKFRLALTVITTGI